MRHPNAMTRFVTRSVTRSPASVSAHGRWRRLACLATGALALSACERAQPEPAPAPKPETPTVVVAPPVLDRAALLAAIDQAASAFASGSAPKDASLAGRRFKVRQPMGCGGPVSTDVTEGVGAVVASARSGDLRLTLTPVDWTPELAGAAGTDAWEAAEGFWLSWPWLRTDTCPRVAAPAPSPTPTPTPTDDSTASTDSLSDDTGTPPGPVHLPAPQTAALVAVFEVDSSRLKRRMGRAYEFTLRGEGGSAPVLDPAGYRVVFEGRMAAFDDGRSIRCHAPSPDRRPVCAAAVHLERVAFETPTGQTLSEWRGG